MSTATRTINNVILTDFHSHCLPNVDDGAADLKTALAMLRAVAEQGVRTVVATPHFYIGQQSPASFFQERQRAYEEIKPHLTGDMPQVLLGAEVLIREGISRYDLRAFCLEGTDVLLVELPFAAPPYWLWEELENIANVQGLTLMLAHLDRYLPWYSRNQLETLMALPNVIVQINADTPADRHDLRYLCKHLPEPRRMVMGSDMHDMTERLPRIEQAVKHMSKHRTGRWWLERMAWTAEHLETQVDDTEGLL